MIFFDVLYYIHELRWSSSDNTLKEPDASGFFCRTLNQYPHGVNYCAVQQAMNKLLCRSIDIERLKLKRFCLHTRPILLDNLDCFQS